MSEALTRRVERRSRQRAANRNAILDAARRVAAREGASELSLRAVAAEAGYAPASVYEYFSSRAELVLALAAEEFAQLAKALRETGGRSMAAASDVALGRLKQGGALAAMVATLEAGQPASEAERHFNGKLIGALTAFAEGAGRAPLKTRGEQADIVLAAATIAGLAMLARTGRLKTLGFEEQEVLARLDQRFSAPL